MPRRWTPEQRARQAELIRNWKPWEKSTGPKTVEGKAIVARNPDKGGQRGKLRRTNRMFKEILREQQEVLELIARDRKSLVATALNIEADDQR